MNPIKDSTSSRACAREAIDAQRRLIAKLAHKVNNPLTYVMNYIFILKQTHSGDAKTMGLMGKVEEGLMRATAIMNGLVDLDAPRFGTPVVCGLHDIVAGAIEAFEAEGVTFINGVEKGATGLVSPGALGEMLTDLFANEVRGHATSITVSHGALKEGGFSIDVSGNGRGLDPMELEAVFDPYESPGGEAAGVGLYAVYLTALHAGAELVCQCGKPTIYSLRFR